MACMACDQPGKRQHLHYRLFDATGRLLYIGRTTCPGQRFSHHKRATPWWPEVATVTFEAQPDHQAFVQGERDAIWIEQPLYNVAEKDRAYPY